MEDLGRRRPLTRPREEERESTRPNATPGGYVRLSAKRVHDAVFHNTVYAAKSGYFEGYRRRGRMPWLLPRHSADKEELFFRELNLEGQVAYDIGAHAGSHTALMARRAHHVYSFEPEPSAFARLAELVSLNSVTNVTLFAVALGHQPGSFPLALPQDGQDVAGTLEPDFQRTLDEAPSINVPVVSLDDWLRLLDLAPPDFMKIDVEGFEDEVLRGAQRTLEEARPELLVEVHGLTQEDKRARALEVESLVPKDYVVSKPFDDGHHHFIPAEKQ
jgi:FkbM family methyltransferase